MSDNYLLRSLKKIFFKIFGRPVYIRRLQWPHIKKLILNSKHENVLDIGASSLILSLKIKKLDVKKLYANDLFFSKDAIEEALKHDIKLIEGDAQNCLPIKEKSIDCIIISSTLHMVPRPDLMLQECKRMLKQEGKIIISVPNNYLFIPKVFNSSPGGFIRNFLKLNMDYDDFLKNLNSRFFVNGPKAYYSMLELEDLLTQNGLKIRSRKFSPGKIGSFFWESAILLTNRFGNNIFFLLFLFLPIAQFLDLLFSSSESSEHIVEAEF